MRGRGGPMAQRPRVTVLGSLNTDISVPVPHLPAPGETVLAAAAATFSAGGKGANQAVAAARLGAAVLMAGCLGDDDFGARLRAGLAAEGIDVAGLRAIPGAVSGLALITVDPAGENSIAVAPGANGLAGAAEVAAAFAEPCDALVLSAEIPAAALAAALRQARAGCGPCSTSPRFRAGRPRCSPRARTGWWSTPRRRRRWRASRPMTCRTTRRARRPSRRPWPRGPPAVRSWSRWARRGRCWPGRR